MSISRSLSTKVGQGRGVWTPCLFPCYRREICSVLRLTCASCQQLGFNGTKRHPLHYLQPIEQCAARSPRTCLINAAVEFRSSHFVRYTRVDVECHEKVTRQLHTCKRLTAPSLGCRVRATQRKQRRQRFELDTVIYFGRFTTFRVPPVCKCFVL